MQASESGSGKAYPMGPTVLIGSRVGNYLIQEKVGEGAMAAVYLARHVQLDRQVAVKVLHPHLEHNPKMVERFFAEARLASSIHDPHVVEIFDVGQLPSGARYFTMEWLEGRSLGYLLATEPPRLPLWRALHFARGIASALVATHARGIVHRDLKPENVFLVYHEGDADFVKVLDFGIALLHEHAPGERKTEAGMILGTPSYMSPEQCRGARAELDARSDIYSLSVILYELLTGQLPFKAEAFGDLLLAHLSQAPTPLRQIDPSIPPSIEAAVLRGLAKDPNERFQRAEEFLRAINLPDGLPDNRAPMSASDDYTHRIVRHAAPSKKRRPFLLVGAAIACVTLASLGILFLRPAPSIAPMKVPTPIEAAIPTPSPAVPVPPTTVQVEIHTTPATAQLRIDGELVANPYRGRFGITDWNHLIEAQAPGYESKNTGLKFDADRKLELTLEKKAVRAVERVNPPPRPLRPATPPQRLVTKSKALITDYPQ